MPELNLPCDGCGGRRYTRTPHGWTRCEHCWPRLLSRTYVKPSLRGGLVDLPAEWLGVEPWPLADVTRSGKLDDFRYMVWRSLLHWYDRVPTYDVLDGWRISEVSFERDADYKTIADLRALSLLVIVYGLAEPPNAGYIAALIRSLLSARTLDGKPTWVYQRRDGLLLQPYEPARDREQIAETPKPARKVLPGLDPWS